MKPLRHSGWLILALLFAIIPAYSQVSATQKTGKLRVNGLRVNGFSVLKNYPDLQIRNKSTLPADYPYKLNWKVDVPIIAVGAVACIMSLPLQPKMMTAEQVKALDKFDLPGIDRIAVGMNDKTAGTTSDFLQYSLVAFAGVSTMMMSEFRGSEFGTLFSMLAEAYVLNLGLSYAFKNGIGRPRPYVYNPGFGDGNFGRSDFQSMVSAHSSTSFMAAVFISKTFSDLYPGNKAKYAVWAVSLTAAAVASALRVPAGAHFTTDVLAGAALGSAIGYLVPWLHQKNLFLKKDGKTIGSMKFSPFGGAYGAGISARIRFS